MSALEIAGMRQVTLLAAQHPWLAVVGRAFAIRHAPSVAFPCFTTHWDPAPGSTAQDIRQRCSG